MSKEENKPERCEGSVSGVESIVIVDAESLEPIDWTDPKEWQKRINLAAKVPDRSAKPFQVTIKLP